MSWSSRSCEALVFSNVYHAASSSPRVIIKSRASSIFVMSDHYLFVIAVTCHSHVVVVWHHMHHIAARYRVSGHMHGRHHGALVIIEIDLAVLVRFGRVYRPHMRLSTLTAVIGCQVHVPQSSPSISIPRARRIVRASSSHSAAIASYSFESRSLKFARVSAACSRSPSARSSISSNASNRMFASLLVF